ncbi:Beta-glucosidase BoGH3B [Sesamum angolense]|uniref:beta-glucosidase n=1 Tax=Sesamum angolense TaxID=2727404 RepID=A0AAE1XC91_9LAMI|nr:Beta-glucosidase BoGH3B [Sesamum angolense]
MGRVTAALVALWLWTAVVEAGYMKYKDPKQPLNVRIKDLISRMSLEEKIGQMTQIERKVASADVIKKYFIGREYCEWGGSVPGPKASAENWIDMVNEFQKGALSTRLGIPMIMELMQFMGIITDPELVKRIGAATALEVRATGIHYTFAPCIAVMVPEEYVEFIDDLTLLVKKNVISMSRINDAVRRILRVKFIMGLFENPMADLRLVDQLGSQDHRELAREAVRKSLVLLKNGKNSNEPLLPLPTSAKKILVAGGHADDIGNQCGGWTIEWNGQTGNITVGTTILTAVKNSVDESTEVVYNESPETEFLKANNFSYAIVVVGELPYVETNGDSKNLTIAEPGYSTIANVCEFLKCVVIIISGRPVYIEPYLEKIDALVAAWLPGTEGQGITDVLFGEYGFTGKLARTWFRTVDQLPMNIGDPHYDPLFPFGYGLTTSPSNTARIVVVIKIIVRRNCGNGGRNEEISRAHDVVDDLLSAAFTEAEYLKYKDPKQPLNVRIKDLMGRMTLEEKIGQMTQIERKIASLMSVLSGGSVPPQGFCLNMVNDLQNGALSTRLGIPMIYGIDAVHGHNNVDPELVKRRATALEVRATGIQYAFAPCIAVCRDPRWGRCYESYSEDHKIVQAMTELIPGLQGDLPANSRKGVPFVAGKAKVAACAKHFVGDGGTVRGIDENNTVIDYKGLLSIHMPAYLDSIRKGVATVMVSYSSWNGKKMHANQDLVTGFLKNNLRFRHIRLAGHRQNNRSPHANYTYSVQAGILAGIDMIMLPEDFTVFIDDLTQQVKNNIIPMSRIDDAVRRILRVKFVMGL